jgi:hypothetical protein
MSKLALLVALVLPVHSLAEEAIRTHDIAGAVRKGRKELLRRLPGIVENPGGDYPVGRIAFPVAALLKSGVSPDNGQIQTAFEKLATLTVEKTYCAACYLFALDALWKAKYKAARAGGRTSTVIPHRATGDAKEKISELASWLVEAQLKQHGSWTYKKADRRSRHDFSNTQFAVLGLQIGLEHGVAIPREAITRVTALFVTTITREKEIAEIEYSVATTLEEKLKITRVDPRRRFRVAPGGWGYTDPRRGRGRRDEPYPSMTAAGASSLVIALRALESSNGNARLQADCKKTLHAAYAWISKHFDDFMAPGKHLFYTLYTLEKAGDLGGIEKFGEHDWYREGAAIIVEKQRKNGGWGSYVNTSFALLFLTRATRPFDPTAPPPILTGGDKETSGPVSSDLVYIEGIDGFLSARALLNYIGDRRRQKLVSIGEEVVRHYAPERREDLVPLLLALWKKPDRITSFAKKALRDITGVRARDKKAYLPWQEQFEQVRALETKKDLTPEEVARQLEKLAIFRLKARVVGLAQRRGMRSLAALFVHELSVPSAEDRYRRKVHGILSLWIDAGIQAPPRDDPAAWKATARHWQAWWRKNGESWAAQQ